MTNMLMTTQIMTLSGDLGIWGWNKFFSRALSSSYKTLEFESSLFFFSKKKILLWTVNLEDKRLTFSVVFSSICKVEDKENFHVCIKQIKVTWIP